MASRKIRDYQCDVVDERVQIYLRDRRRLGTQGPKVFFVQCNQEECQYVDKNEKPCQLHVEMFAEEIDAQEKERQERKDNRAQW